MTSLLWVSLLGGCWTNSAVYERYQAEKRKALAVPGDAPASWKPDVRVEIAPELLDRLISFGLEQQGAFRAEVALQGIGKATPELHVEALKLRPAKACEACFTVDLSLAGDIDWQAGVLGKGTVPGEARATFELELSTTREGDEIAVKVLPRDVRSVSLEIPGWSGAVKRAAIGPLERWLNEQVEQLEPVTVTTFGGEDVPVRAVRLKPRGKGLTALLLTQVAQPGVVAEDGGRTPREGFIIWVAYDTLVSFAAKQAFEQGPQDYDIVAVPTSLTAKRSGFDLGLRLWGLGGAGWWRDYQAHGGFRTENGEISLKANTVEQTGMSKGAVQADPLIHLGQSLVLDSISEAMTVAVPTIHRQRGSGTAAKATITGISGQPTGLQVFGNIDLARLRGVDR